MDEALSSGDLLFAAALAMAIVSMAIEWILRQLGLECDYAWS
jgi:hypothetical protein